jgi:hypothetical protein
MLRKVEKNFTAYGKLNQASSSTTKSEPKKNIFNVTSSENKMMTFLVDFMKMMGAIFLKKHKPSNNKIKLCKTRYSIWKGKPIKIYFNLEGEVVRTVLDNLNMIENKRFPTP